MIYRKKQSKNGRTMYFVGDKLTEDNKIVGGKMISKEDIPTDILRQLENTEIVQSDILPQQDHFESPFMPDTKTCVVCGEEAQYQKFLLGDLYGLCREDYLHRTSGEIAQAIREN